MVIYPEIRVPATGIMGSGLFNRVENNALIMWCATATRFTIQNVDISVYDWGLGNGGINTDPQLEVPLYVGTQAGRANNNVIDGSYFIRFSINGISSNDPTGATPPKPMSFYLEDIAYLTNAETNAVHDSVPWNMLVGKVVISGGGTNLSFTMYQNKQVMISPLFTSSVPCYSVSANAGCAANSDIEIINFARTPTTSDVQMAAVAQSGADTVNGGANYSNYFTVWNREQVQMHSYSDFSTGAGSNYRGEFRFRVMAL